MFSLHIKVMSSICHLAIAFKSNKNKSSWDNVQNYKAYSYKAFEGIWRPQSPHPASGITAWKTLLSPYFAVKIKSL